ncbi:9335_t:CDS:2, partial [Gigaspora margarita]
SDLNLEKLKLWPTDKQITETIHHSYRLACELTEFLSMIQPEDLSMNKENLLTDNNISSAINNISKEVDQISNNLYNNNKELIPANIFQNGQRYLKNVDQILDPDLLSILNNGDSGKYLV